MTSVLSVFLWRLLTLRCPRNLSLFSQPFYPGLLEATEAWKAPPGHWRVYNLPGETAAVHIMPATQNVINTCLREEVSTLNMGAQLTPIHSSSRLLLSSYYVPRILHLGFKNENKNVVFTLKEFTVSMETRKEYNFCRERLGFKSKLCLLAAE